MITLSRYICIGFASFAMGLPLTAVAQTADGLNPAGTSSANGGMLANVGVNTDATGSVADLEGTGALRAQQRVNDSVRGNSDDAASGVDDMQSNRVNTSSGVSVDNDVNSSFNQNGLYRGGAGVNTSTTTGTTGNGASGSVGASGAVSTGAGATGAGR